MLAKLHGFGWHGFETAKRERITIECAGDRFGLTVRILLRRMHDHDVRGPMMVVQQHGHVVLAEFVQPDDGLVVQRDVQVVFEHVDVMRTQTWGQ